jgi:hypothetical protein
LTTSGDAHSLQPKANRVKATLSLTQNVTEVV